MKNWPGVAIVAVAGDCGSYDITFLEEVSSGADTCGGGRPPMLFYLPYFALPPPPQC